MRRFSIQQNKINKIQFCCPQKLDGTENFEIKIYLYIDLTNYNFNLACHEMTI